MWRDSLPQETVLEQNHAPEEAYEKGMRDKLKGLISCFQGKQTMSKKDLISM